MKIAYFSYVYGEDGGTVHTREFTIGEGRSTNWHRMRQALKRWLSRWLHEPREVLLNLPFLLREFRFLRAVRPDVLIVRQSFAKISGVLLGRWLGIPTLLEVNAPGTLESSRYYHEYWHLPLLPGVLERWAIRHADGVVTVSEALRDYLSSVHRIPADRITVNPNGADTDRFDRASAAPPATLQLPEGSTIVGFCASFQEFHGMEELLAVISGLAGLPQVHFLLVGDGPARSRIEESLRSKDHDGRVTLVGRVTHDRIPSYLAAMDIGIMPRSNFYGSPIKVIEYMAMGLPVVAPRLGPLCEVVDHEVNGLLFEPDDVAELIESIRVLVTRPDLRARMGTAARASVLQNLTWRHNAGRVAEACRRAIARRRGESGEPRR
jgi:glycosyltransferase involved in cell wall biosynthesis